MSTVALLRPSQARPHSLAKVLMPFAMVTICAGAFAQSPHASPSMVSPLTSKQVQARLSQSQPAAVEEVRLMLVPVADSPYLTLQDEEAATLPAKVLFVCGVAAPRFAGGGAVARWSRTERDEDTGTMLVHLDDCHAASAAQAF